MELADLSMYSMHVFWGASGFGFYRQSVPTERTPGSLEQSTEDLWIPVGSGFLQTLLFM